MNLNLSSVESPRDLYTIVGLLSFIEGPNAEKYFDEGIWRWFHLKCNAVSADAKMLLVKIVTKQLLLVSVEFLVLGILENFDLERAGIERL